MTRPGATGERLLALFSLGVLLFNPPLLKIFGTGAYVFGVPLLYVYLFVAWAALIALAAALVARSADRPPGADAARGSDKDE